jgi:formylglycine-generating enzyme required for sulfatase activity
MQRLQIAGITFALFLSTGIALADDKNQVLSDPTTGMEFVSVPGGCFRMGDSFGDGEPDEYPVHEVCVDGFSMGKYPVTVGEFRKFVNDTGYRTEAEKGGGCFTVQPDGKWPKTPSANWKNPGFSQADRHPAVCISWNDANEFSKWLTRKGGRTYRLPTEAEWEYAARAGTTGRNYWGNRDDDVCKYANVSDQSAKGKYPGWKIFDCDDGHTYTAPVGSYKPNAFGLYDMMGNAWQWTGDWYGEDYYEESPRKNPQGPTTGRRRVPRGGSWRSSSTHVRASLRIHPPASQSAGVGFRLVSPVQ